MKNDVNWYMNEAKKLNNIKSDRQLAVRMEMASLHKWRNPDRHDVPSVAAMMKLAHLAKVPVDIALVHRDLWEAEFKTPEAVPIFKKILKSLPKYAAMLTILVSFIVVTLGFDSQTSAEASPLIGSASAGTIYIMEHFNYPILASYRRLCSISMLLFRS